MMMMSAGIAIRNHGSPVPETGGVPPAPSVTFGDPYPTGGV